MFGLLRNKREKPVSWRQCLVGTLCLCLFVWATVPAASHTPKFLDTIQEHLQMIEEHGHSHGLELDVLWAMHGHQHDRADHDHNPAVLVFPPFRNAHLHEQMCWQLPFADATSITIHPPRRPPKG